MNDQDARRIIENWIAIQRYSLTVGNLIGGMIDDMLRELRGLIGAENATQQIADVVRRYFFLIRSTMTQEQIAAAERLVEPRHARAIERRAAGRAEEEHHDLEKNYPDNNPTPSGLTKHRLYSSTRSRMRGIICSMSATRIPPSSRRPKVRSAK